MLPGIDGFEVFKYLREKNPQMGVIMLTARTHEQDKVLGLEYGADDYISKPFSPTELVARIRSLIRRLTSSHIDEKQDILKSGPFTLNLSDIFKECKEISKQRPDIKRNLGEKLFWRFKGSRCKYETYQKENRR